MMPLEILQGEPPRNEKGPYRAEDFGIDIEDGFDKFPHQFPNRDFAGGILLATVGAVLPVNRQRVMAIVAIARRW